MLRIEIDWKRDGGMLQVRRSIGGQYPCVAGFDEVFLHVDKQESEEDLRDSNVHVDN